MHLFGKDLQDVIWFHRELAEANQEMMQIQTEVEKLYSEAPPRDDCILCGETLAGPLKFEREYVVFVICSFCGHMNGNHLITPEFVASAYTTGSKKEQTDSLYGKQFSSGKMIAEYWQVVERIYQPKADFLLNFLQSRAHSVKQVGVLDAGCGPGHFVNALIQAGFGHVRGFDSLGVAVESAQRIGGLSESQVSLQDPDRLVEELAACDEQVVSMMCVLVHLESPLDALRAMRKNPNVRYTFQKIPLWSFATILEAAIPDLHSRVLGADHTNVFSHESLEWVENEMGMKRVASWSFGGDALDLQRKILLLMARRGGSPELVSRAESELASLLEGFQFACDTNKMASEIHLVWEFA